MKILEILKHIQTIISFAVFIFIMGLIFYGVQRFAKAINSINQNTYYPRNVTMIVTDTIYVKPDTVVHWWDIKHSLIMPIVTYPNVYFEDSMRYGIRKIITDGNLTQFYIGECGMVDADCQNYLTGSKYRAYIGNNGKLNVIKERNFFDINFLIGGQIYPDVELHLRGMIDMPLHLRVEGQVEYPFDYGIGLYWRF